MLVHTFHSVTKATQFKDLKIRPELVGLKEFLPCICKMDGFLDITMKIQEIKQKATNGLDQTENTEKNKQQQQQKQLN